MSVKEIAKKADVSIATVSRVLNNRPGVSEKAVQRVQDAVRAMKTGAMRSPAALATRGYNLKTRQVALLWTCSISGALTNVGTGLMEGVTSTLSANGLSLMVEYLEGASNLPERIENGQVDGILMQGPEPCEAFMARLRRYPLVWMLTSGSNKWGDHVEPNNDRIGHLAAEVLTKRGHTHIGCVTNPFNHDNSNYWTMRARAFDYYGGAMGAKVDMIGKDWLDDMLPARFTCVSRIVDEFLALSPRPTALFIVNEMTTAIYHELNRRGIRPMHDVDLMTVNREHLWLSGFENHPLVIDIRPEAIGQMAVSHLLWRMDAGLEFPRMKIQVDPVVVTDDLEEAPDTTEHQSEMSGTGREN